MSHPSLDVRKLLDAIHLAVKIDISVTNRGFGNIRPKNGRQKIFP
jgi:hypothetical protein